MTIGSAKKGVLQSNSINLIGFPIIAHPKISTHAKSSQIFRQSCLNACCAPITLDAHNAFINFRDDRKQWLSQDFVERGGDPVLRGAPSPRGPSSERGPSGTNGRN